MLKTVLFVLLFLGAVGFLCAQTDPDWIWAKRAGGTANYGDNGQEICTDQSGNIYVTGYYNGTATFGPSTLGSLGSQDIFVAKLDPSGNWLWARNAGGSGYDSGRGICVDPAGNCYITGYYSSTAAFGSFYLSGSSSTYSAYVAKLDPAGNFLWAARASSTNTVTGEDICADADGNTFIAGYLEGTATFGTLPSLVGAGRSDFLVAKLNSAGNWLWAVKGGGSSYDRAYGVDLDSSGNIYAAGYFQNTATFGAFSVTSGGQWDDDALVAKLDASGNWLWLAQGFGSNRALVNALDTDPAGNSYVTGFIMGTAVFGTTSLTSSGSDDAFVAKVDSAGNWLWANKGGGTSSDCGNDICLDNAGYCWITGYYTRAASFGTWDLTAYVNYDYDIFVAKLDSSGNWQTAFSGGGGETDYSMGICPVNGTDCLITGFFEGTAYLGALTLSSVGGADVFVALVSETLSPGVPLPPENLSITPTGNDLILAWDPVNLDTDGQAVTPSHYKIYFNPFEPYEEYGEYTPFPDEVIGTQWTHTGAALQPYGFYYIKAVRTTP